MDLYTFDCPDGTPESRYIPLDVMSDYSIGESIARIPDLVKKAKSLNMKALALTDRTLAGAIEFYLLCKTNNIKPIIGQKIALANNEVNLLCKDFDAYKILCSVFSALADRFRNFSCFAQTAANMAVTVAYDYQGCKAHVTSALNDLRNAFDGYYLISKLHLTCINHCTFHV